MEIFIVKWRFSRKSSKVEVGDIDEIPMCYSNEQDHELEL